MTDKILRELAVLLTLVLIIGLLGCNRDTERKTELVVDETLNIAATEMVLSVDETEAIAVESEENIETDTIETIPLLTNSVYPLPSTVDLDNLEDCTLHVSLMGDDIFQNDEIWKMQVNVYNYEQFDAVEVANLDIGKTLVVNGHQVEVDDIKRIDNGAVIINGGVDNGGYELVTCDDGVYHSIVYGMKSFYEIGSIVLNVSPDFVYVDESVSNGGVDIGAIEDLIADFAAGECFGTPHDATIVVEDGMVVELHRSKTPYFDCAV